MKPTESLPLRFSVGPGLQNVRAVEGTAYILCTDVAWHCSQLGQPSRAASPAGLIILTQYLTAVRVLLNSTWITVQPSLPKSTAYLQCKTGKYCLFFHYNTRKSLKFTYTLLKYTYSIIIPSFPAKTRLVTSLFSCTYI